MPAAPNSAVSTAVVSEAERMLTTLLPSSTALTASSLRSSRPFTMAARLLPCWASRCMRGREAPVIAVSAADM